MQTYFPYSQIINLGANLKQIVTRHKFFGEWQVSESEPKASSKSTTIAISELYY